MEEKQVIIITTESQLEYTFNKLAEKRELAQKAKKKMELEERLTRREAAKFLDVSYQTMYNWVKERKLKEYGISRKKFFLKSELLEVIKND